MKAVRGSVCELRESSAIIRSVKSFDGHSRICLIHVRPRMFGIVILVVASVLSSEPNAFASAQLIDDAVAYGVIRRRSSFYGSRMGRSAGFTCKTFLVLQ
jgi:hypothetical protein